MINKLKAAYKGKKVFLTGHTGFKGSWLLMILSYLGAEVKGYALAPDQNPDLFTLLNGDKLCNSVIGDIRNLSMMEKEIISFQPDFIFHLAAQALVRKSFEAPLDTFATNITGTANLLDAARRLNKKCSLVIVTTDKVYENLETGKPYSETDPLGGYDPYSSSKACAEIVTSSYRRSFFNPDNFDTHQKAIATARAGNVIGGGDWSPDRIIPDLIRALDSNRPLEVRNPNSIRPWQHVLEPLSGYLLLGALLDSSASEFGKAYNFGPEITDNLTVKELVDKAIKIWGHGDYKDASNPDAPHEAKLLHLDITKAKNELGWKPKMASSEAISLTLDWYKNYRNGAGSITLNQIRGYFEN